MESNETRNFGTAVDETLLAEFRKCLPRTYTVRRWMELMMRLTIEMDPKELDRLMEGGD